MIIIDSFSAHFKFIKICLIIFFVFGCKEKKGNSYNSYNGKDEKKADVIAIKSTDLRIKLFSFMELYPIDNNSKQVYIIDFINHNNDTLISMRKSLKVGIFKEKTNLRYIGGVYLANNPVLVIDDEEKYFGKDFYIDSLLDKQMPKKYDYEEFDHNDFYDRAIYEYKLRNGNLEFVRSQKPKE